MSIPSMLRQVFSKGYNSEVAYLFDTDIEIVNGVLLYRRGKLSC
jgi:CRISPR-associated protein Cas5d